MFFDTSCVLAEDSHNATCSKRQDPNDTAVLFRAPPVIPNPPAKATLVASNQADFLTLEGELNKLAANISIGLDMAGVHYFSDYYDSLRMGVEIALGILEEQGLTHATDPCVLSVPTFDGDAVSYTHLTLPTNREV